MLASAATIVGACGARTPLPYGETVGELPKDAGNTRDVKLLPDANVQPRCVSALPENGATAANLEIVLDGSGSMDSDNKWQAASAALDSIFADLARRNDPALAVGLLVFEDVDDPTQGSGPYPASIDVAPRVVDDAQLAALQKRLATQPSGGTPTALALEGAYRLLENYTAPPPMPKDARKVVVLLSDGVPNGGTTEQQQCIALARAENQRADPIRTFAVGIGPFPGGSQFSYDPTFMGNLAVAGGTPAFPGCNPSAQVLSDVCHFQITPNGRPVAEVTQDFVSAMNDIRGQLAPACEFTLVGNVANADLSLTTVTWIDGAGAGHPVPRDPKRKNGWSYDDDNKPSHLSIFGDSCTSILGDARGHVDVRFTCGG